jgi:protein-S-isoprenylcysteine O-methyltransferase Ste14
MIQRLFAKSMMVLSVVCGVGSLLLFAAFPVGSYARGGVRWPLSGILFWDGLLCLAFFLQHSGMVRRGFQDRISGIVPRRFHRALYSIASGLVLTGLVILWQPSGVHLFLLEGPFRLAAYAGTLLAIAVFVWGAFTLKSLDLFGLAAIQANLRGTPEPVSGFLVRGPYRWVRHPWYAAAILLIWSCVDVTADRLLFNVLWTGWICIGAWLEEKDLRAEFGDVYDEYRRRVPMLVPWRPLGLKALAQRKVAKAFAGRLENGIRD